MKDIIGILIPLVGVVMGCGIAMLSIYVDYRKRREMFALYHQERMAAIEKGLELPPLPEEFFKDKDKRESPHSDLGWGLFWFAGGLALLAALYFNMSPVRSLYALIPIAVGLHYLIYYAIVGRKEARAAEASRTQGETGSQVTMD